MKRMTVAQKRAIWYSMQKKQEERQWQIIEKYNLDFGHSKYTRLTWFLKDCRKKGLLPLEVDIY